MDAKSGARGRASTPSERPRPRSRPSALQQFLRELSGSCRSALAREKPATPGRSHIATHASLLQRLLLALFLLLPGLGVYAADYLSHTQTPHGLAIKTNEGALTLTFHQPGAIEAFYQPDGYRQLPSFSIAAEPKPVVATLTETPAELVYQSAELSAHIRKSPLQISYYRGDELLIAEEKGAYANEIARGFRFKLSADEKLMGGGERVLGMDRRGHKLPLYNKASYGYTTQAEQMYFSLPAVMSSKKYILLFDNSATGSVDLGKTEADILEFRAVAGRTSYLVFSGADYPAVIQNYVRVTGTQPLPPRWAFGNYASRFGYRSEAEVRDTVDRFIAEDIPLDAVVIDLYWFGPDIKGHMGRLDWDRNTFPTPEKMTADLSAKGVNTILVTEPFILTTSARWQEAVDRGVLAMDFAGRPKTFDFYFGNTGLVDVFKPEAADWFWSIYAGLMQQGVAGWWGDLGEPEVHPDDAVHALGTADEIHNAYGHQWAKLVYEHHVRDYPERRPFIMMRAGAPGSQRFGMIPWTGDVDRSWGGLKPQVELALQMGLLGMAYTHSDLGGFAGGKHFDRELYLRWLQYGVFQPVYRPHAQDHIASEPVFHDRKTREIARAAIKLRYRLLPYLYTLAYENSTTGMPLMRPLFFADDRLIDRSDAYFWGDAFLVAPVVAKGVKRVAIDLPAGQWFDFWSDQPYSGDQRVRVPVSLQTIPVLVKAGAFVPMIKDIHNTGEYSTQALELHYYADDSVASASGQLYDDDGASRQALENGQYELLKFAARQQSGTLDIDLVRSGGDYRGKPQSRQIELSVHHWTQAPTAVSVGGQALVLASSRAEWEAGTGAAWYDAKAHHLKLRFDWQAAALAVAVR